MEERRESARRILFGAWLPVVCGSIYLIAPASLLPVLTAELTIGATAALLTVNDPTLVVVLLVLDILEIIANRGLTYVVPKRMQTSEKAQVRRLLQRDEDYYVTDRGLHLGNNEWHETTLVYRRKENSDWTDTANTRCS